VERNNFAQLSPNGPARGTDTPEARHTFMAELAGCPAAAMCESHTRYVAVWR
jgi:hypothetical protein